MALGFNKNRDTLDIFNDRWKANHNQKQVTDYKEKVIKFNKKMLGLKVEEKNNDKVVRSNSVSDKVNSLNRQIASVDSINRNMKINSVIDKFRK